MSGSEFLWYIPNTVEPGHRGDDTIDGWGSIEYSTGLALAAERHGWGGALLGTGWGRPDTFTVATALAARTTTFKPLIAIRPGYWSPAHFASSAATLDQLSRGRVLVNIVSGLDNLAAYGDVNADPARRYDRTREFLHLLRRLWTEDSVTFAGEHFQVVDSTVSPHPYAVEDRVHPTLYFGGASEAAERVSAEEADVQLFWGEPLEGLAERIDRLRVLSERLGRRHRPLEFGLRITTLIRDTTEEAWHDAESKVAKLAGRNGGTATSPSTGTTTGEGSTWNPQRTKAVGQRRLYELAERGEVLDTCLYTTPGKFGGGGAATTWLVGSADEVAAALEAYRKLGITHFVLSDTPYQQELERVGDQLLPLLRGESADRTGATRTSAL
jgi:alkanesulfonate monooxygenase